MKLALALLIPVSMACIVYGALHDHAGIVSNWSAILSLSVIGFCLTPRRESK